MWLQGDASRPSARAATDGARQRLGSLTPNCSYSPSGQACGFTRCRSTGSTTQIRASTSLQTAIADLRGIARLTRDLARGRIPLRAHRDEALRGPLGAQLFRFCGVGIASTIAYVALFLVFANDHVGHLVERDRAADNSVGNTAVNRSFTFGVRGRTARLQHQLQGLTVFGIGLALSTGALAAVHATAPHAGDRSKSRPLVLANLAATILRFLAVSIVGLPQAISSTNVPRTSTNPRTPVTSQGVLMTTTAPAMNTVPTISTVPVRHGDSGRDA